MKVNNNGVNSTGAAQVRSKEIEKDLKTNANKSATEAGGLFDSTKVNVSKEAQAFQKAKAIASKDSVDEAKVARIQKMIDEGKYKIDSEAVADRLVDAHLQMGE